MKCYGCKYVKYNDYISNKCKHPINQIFKNRELHNAHCESVNKNNDCDLYEPDFFEKISIFFRNRKINKYRKKIEVLKQKYPERFI